MPPVQREAHRIAVKAFHVELKRAPTPQELAPLQTQAQKLEKNHDDAFVLKRLERKLDHSPEGKAINQAYGAAHALLGRAPDSTLLTQARELAAQGKSPTEVRAAIEASIKAGPEYRLDHAADTVKDAYQNVLQRKVHRDEKVDAVKWTRDLINQGKSADEVTQAWKDKLGATPEGRKVRAPETVSNLYKFVMGRDASPDELNAGVAMIRGTDMVTGLVDQGKTDGEINGVFGQQLEATDEWKLKHPQLITDRNAIFMHQPTGWTCGPTSLAMAMIAAGKRPRTEDTIWEMAQPDKLNTIANQSTDKMPGQIADLVRGMGANAEPHELADVATIRAGLERGHGMIVNGKLPDTSGHFIYLAGIDLEGKMIVCDPWHDGTTQWSDEQLASFVAGRGNSVEVWP